jgi:RIO-like serine/threonine protein kinase
LRLYRWCEGEAREMIVSTPRLAAKTNMDEKVCRTHLHALISEGFIERSTDHGQIARFGGSDRNARGLILKLSSNALLELIS